MESRNGHSRKGVEASPTMNKELAIALSCIVGGLIVYLLYLSICYRPQMKRVLIGGTPQWILTRGSGSRVIVWLSGGPGTDESFLLRHFHSDLERDFKVVYWIQRGCGRSFSFLNSPSQKEKSKMNIEQFVEDLRELIDIIQAERGSSSLDKIILVGHSWGTVIGVKYAARYPETISAYIGVGQVSDMKENEAEGVKYALRCAEEGGDVAAVSDLRRLPPPPYSIRDLFTQRKYIRKFGGAWHRPFPLWKLILLSYSVPGSSLIDLLKYLPGESYSIDCIWDELSHVELTTSVPALDVPVAFLLGLYDMQVVSSLAAKYFENLKSPRKKIEWFEASAHSPPFEEPKKFAAVLRETIDYLLQS